jgi:outer membrane protease
VRTIYGFALFVSIFGAAAFKGAFLHAEEANNTPYAFSTGTSTGFLFGQGEEIVYWPGNHDDFGSQLLWDIKPLFYAGPSLDFSRRNPLEKWGFFGILNLKFGIPAKTGTMEDRDWSNAPDQLSHFSSHDNYTQGAILFDISAGVSIPIRNTLYVKAFGALSYMRFNWASRDGYKQYAVYDYKTGEYGPWTEDIDKVPGYGPAINYSQNWFEPFILGVSIHYPLLRRFTLSLSTQFCPFIVIAHGRDDHLNPLKKIQYDDYMNRGASFKPQGEISFSPDPRLSVSFLVGGILMFKISGSSY